MGYLQNLMDRHPTIPALEIPYDYNYNMQGKSRTDWSGTQGQRWTSPQRKPQKTKFPYGLTTTRTRIGNRSQTVDATGGKWYFEEELIFATPANKRDNNIWQSGYTGGLILMTIYEAREMELSREQVIKHYRSDQAVKKNADKYGYEAPHYFFNYRKDWSIESLYVPPPPPPPIIKYIEVEVPATPPPDKIEAPPEPVFEVSKPEPIAEEQRVVKVSKPEPVVASSDNTKWILLAIVGLGILIAIIFILRSRNG